jgi:hypothetical protein
MKSINGITLLKGVQDLKVEIEDYDNKQIKYRVWNTPICQFDQHSRARIGVKFSNYKVCVYPEYVLYSNLYDKMDKDSTMTNKFVEAALKLEKVRETSDFKDPYNLMSRNCYYEVVQDYSSLAGQMSRRLKLCEEQFIVGLHWLLRDKMIKLGIEKANSFLPGCDLIQKCDYASADYLSNAFGCLFTGCGRWPSHAKYASFNQSCTTYDELESELQIKIQRSNYDGNL